MLSLHANTAGVRGRLATNSKYIGIYARYPYAGKMSHFPLTGSAGFDLYTENDGRQVHIKSFVPKCEIVDTLNGEIELSDGVMREYKINFPLHSDASELYVILDEDAEVKLPRKYRYETPIVYYGSSITQGGCASHPENSYQSIISRNLDCDYINLGFSGSAKGEAEMAGYISGLKMSMFVYDYALSSL